LPANANLNSSVRDRRPDGFAAAARRAVADGFRNIKLAPFDGFPALSDTARVKAALDQGVACVEAVRAAVGASVGVMIDCHSFFTVAMAIETAQRLKPQNLAWYEEPVAPEKTEETLAIKRAIPQPMAGGEMLFGIGGFQAMCQRQAVDVIMPDVKHCGGLLEFTRIAAMAAAHGVEVSPHNPAGPVSTAAALQACAGIANFRICELQTGEVDWRAEVLDPPERVVNGAFRLSEAPGLGCRLNERVVRKHRL
jgi:galactonate dehydratase